MSDIGEIHEINTEAVKAPEPDSERFLPWAKEMFGWLKRDKELTDKEIAKVQKALDDKEYKRAGTLIEKYFWRSVYRDAKNGIIY